jgi:hypothetical protein
MILFEQFLEEYYTNETEKNKFLDFLKSILGTTIINDLKTTVLEDKHLLLNCSLEFILYKGILNPEQINDIKPKCIDLVYKNNPTEHKFIIWAIIKLFYSMDKFRNLLISVLVIEYTNNDNYKKEPTLYFLGDPNNINDCFTLLKLNDKFYPLIMQREMRMYLLEKYIK